MEVEAEKVKKAYDKFKQLLTAKEEDIITRYYGINEQVRHSLAEIGEMLGVTRERIRQIKDKALVKLKIKEAWGSQSKKK